MKKIISLVLALVFMFSLAVPSFAVTADEQADKLTTGWGTGTNNNYPLGYSTSWFYHVLTWLDTINDNLDSIDGSLDILSSWNTDISSISIISEAFQDLDNGWFFTSHSIPSGFGASFFAYVADGLYWINYELESVDDSLSSIKADVANLDDYLLGNFRIIMNDIYSDVDMLQQVLADSDDLALKNSQKQNQEAIEESFFDSDSDLSINTNKIGKLTGLATSFTEGFDLSKYGSGSPLEYLGEGSAFASWFTEEVGKDMDPTYLAPSGDDTFPWPDVPEEPDEPDVPVPETTATPVISYNSNSFTVTAVGNGSVLLYVNGSQVSNPYTFTQTYDTQTFVVTATAQESGKLISETARLEVTVPAKERETTATPTITYNESTFTVSASGNGTVLLYVNGSQVSNPYTFTQGQTDVTYVVTATAQESDKLISQTARLDITVSGEEPEPVPETTATPVINYNSNTFTVTAVGNGSVLLYVNGSQVSNPYTFTQTYDTQTFVVTATAQESGKLISETARLEVTVPAKERETTATPTITYNESTFTVSASGNGTVLLYVNGSQVSNPYTFTQGDTDVTYVVTATAQETDKLISQTARLDVTVEAPAPIFPSAPSAYTLIDTYTSSLTFTAPEDGYYKIEVYGASGNGGSSDFRLSGLNATYYGGGGGGGGAFCSSDGIKLKSGDTIFIGGTLVPDGTVTVYINSSVSSYSNLVCVSGASGSNGSVGSVGVGGSGGTASGGTLSNISGSAGSNGRTGSNPQVGGDGGSSAVAGGNVGADGGASVTSGSSAFIKIYRGNTNVVAGTFSLRAPKFDYTTPTSSDSIVTSFYQKRNFSLLELLFGGAK